MAHKQKSKSAIIQHTTGNYIKLEVVKKNLATRHLLFVSNHQMFGCDCFVHVVFQRCLLIVVNSFPFGVCTKNEYLSSIVSAGFQKPLLTKLCNCFCFITLLGWRVLAALCVFTVLNIDHSIRFYVYVCQGLSSAEVIGQTINIYTIFMA